MTDRIENLKRLCEGATEGPWDFSSHQSGTVCVTMRQWVGPKSSKYGTGYLAAHINAFNIDFQDEKEVDRQKFCNGQFIAASREALPELIRLLEMAEGALDAYAKDFRVFEDGPTYTSWVNKKVREALQAIAAYRSKP